MHNSFWFHNAKHKALTFFQSFWMNMFILSNILKQPNPLLMTMKKIYLALLHITIKMILIKFLMNNKFHFFPWFRIIRYLKTVKAFFTFHPIGIKYSLISKTLINNKIMRIWFNSKILNREIMRYKTWYYKNKYNKENLNHLQSWMN